MAVLCGQQNSCQLKSDAVVLAVGAMMDTPPRHVIVDAMFHRHVVVAVYVSPSNTASINYQVKSGQVRSDRVGSGRVGSDRVGSGQIRSGRVRSGRVGSGRVRSGQVKSGQVRSGQITMSARNEDCTRRPTSSSYHWPSLTSWSLSSSCRSLFMSRSDSIH